MAVRHLRTLVRAPLKPDAEVNMLHHFGRRRSHRKRSQLHAPRQSAGDTVSYFGAMMVVVALLAGGVCVVVAPVGQRTRMALGGLASGQPKKQAAVDWL